MRDKPHIERLFGSVASLFAQFVSGYTGSNPGRRGRMAGDKPLWSMQELQDLLAVVCAVGVFGGSGAAILRG